MIRCVCNKCAAVKKKMIPCLLEKIPNNKNFKPIRLLAYFYHPHV